MITRALWQKTWYPNILVKIRDGYKEIPPQYSTIFNVKGSTNPFELALSAAGLGLPVQTQETEEAFEDGPNPGFPKRYDFQKYTKKVGTSEEMIEDKKMSVWDEMGPDMGYSFRQLDELLCADAFNTATTTNGPDGVPLASTLHPNIGSQAGPGGGTQSNILNPVGTVSVVAVRLMLTQGLLLFDLTGVRRTDYNWEYLWHPPQVKYDVLEILKSAGRPDTANRADNVIQDALKPFCWRYLLNAKMWGMVTGKNQHRLKMYNKKAFSISETHDEDAGVFWVIGKRRVGVGYDDYRGTFFSNPA